jgi:hypothetical protein
MKKQELIHLHGLLAQVQDQYAHEVDSDVDMSKYEAVGVKSTSIHRSKTDHKEAVFALSECLTEDMADVATDKSAVTAD